MHTNQFKMDADGLTTEITNTHTDETQSQHTNNLDGILRDCQDNPLLLNQSDYKHQAYLGPDRRGTAPKELHERYIYKDGKFIKVDDIQNPYTVSSNIIIIA